MKQILILLISVILFSCSNGDKRYHIDETTSPKDTLTYLKSDMSLLNGIVFCEFGDNGKYINGKKDGIHKKWYEDGQLEIEINFKDGKWDGIFKEWYENNQIKQEGNWENNRTIGLWKIWYENGQLKSESDFINGKFDGLYRDWYENGQLRSERNYTDGVENGIKSY